jgi:serine/threonine protein kinase
LAANGEMFDYLATLGKFPEPICRFYFKQLLSALDYINSKGYCHRDLKPENLFFDEQFNLKLADFGFATVLQGKLGDGNLTTILGTESYMAPELSIKSQKYHGVPADLFSASVILFIFMTGRPPFRSAHPKDDRYGKMCRNQHKNFWKDIIARGHNLDTSFMELLTSLFAFDPVNRPSIAEIMTSPWMKGQTATHEEAYAWLSKGKQKVDKSMADQKIKDDEDKKKQKAQKNPNQNMAFTETVAHRGEGRSEKSEKKIANDALMAEKLEAMDLNRMSLPVKCCDGILPNTLISGLDRKTFVEHCMQTSSVLALGDLDWNVEKFRAKFVTKGTEMPGDGSEVGVSVTLTECGRGLKYVDISRTSGSAIKFMEIRDNFRQEFEKLLPELEPTA